MENPSIEQKAHDLTVAYVTHLFSHDSKIASTDDFVQEYNNSYDMILKAVKANG